jgi:4-amino-4-deoxychorismate lyase
LNAVVLVDGEPATHIDAQDRGLLYGDGLFETVLFVDGKAPLWQRHMQRMAHGCERLRLAMPDAATLAHECAQVGAGSARGVVRITLTRGSGERGYAPPRRPHERRIVAAAAAAELPGDWCSHGITVGFCTTRLAAQPLLAGLKHLNRLEQVLARAEWNDPAIAEGLMFDSHECVISATAANLFAVIDGTLVTPAVDQCGIAGVARAEVLARTHGEVTMVTRDGLARAEEVFLTSSVRGILPVRTTPDRHYEVGAQTRALQTAWRELGLMEPL